MKDNMSTPQEGQMPGDDELKKLRKREQRALERLQEARKAQAKALERFQRAEARLQKRGTRLQRIEGRLTLLRQQLEQIPEQAAQASNEAPPVPQTQPETNPSRVGAGLVPALEIERQTQLEADPSSVGAGLVPALEGEDTHLENEAVPVVALAIEENVHLESADNHATGENVDSEGENARAAAEATEENVRLAAERASSIASLETDAGQWPDAMVETPQRAETLATPEEIAIIEEEEALIAAGTAETIAHITAERAAKAEVIAEISSKQTREARRYVQDAEQAHIEVRTAISNGILTGEEAQEALWRAEHAVTRAQAFLADAEANEEQAVKAAMNAEADAEVAEGMAFASTDHLTVLAIADEQQNSDETQPASIPTQEHTPENDDEADVTTKISVMRPQEQA